MRYAGFWRRAAAHLIDFAVIDAAVPWVVENIVFGAMYGVYYLIARHHGGPIKGYDDAFDPLMEQIVSVIVGLAVLLPYYIWSTYRFGTTLGKRPFRIYVVRASDGGPITLGQSTLRCLGYALSYATFGCGFLMAAFHPQKRCLHDLIAGTVSIIKDK
jgi:uncharacterized RDD family membrane protein YckC